MAAKTNPANLSFTDFEVSNKHHNTLNIKHIRIFRMYIVLQCCSSKNGCMKVWNELYIYIYRYRTIFCVWERLLENCNTATLQQNVVFSWFRLTVFTPFPSVVKKNQKKLSKNSWTAMTMLYLCTRKIEHAPACNRRSTSFESEGAVHVVTRKMRKKHPLPPPSKSQSGWDSRRRKQRENETANDSPSFFDRLTYPKNRSNICSVTKIVEFTLIYDNGLKEIVHCPKICLE